MTRKHYIAQLGAAVRARRLTAKQASAVLAKADAAHRPVLRKRPTMSGPPRPSTLGSDIASVARNPFVRAGADAIGTAFGDPQLGEQVAAVASVLAVPINAIAGLADGSVYYSPAELAANAAAVVAGMTPDRRPVLGRRIPE